MNADPSFDWWRGVRSDTLESMRRALAYLLTAALAGSGACANTTLLPPDMDTDCDDVADSEKCSDDGSEPDVPEPIDSIELECDNDGSLIGTGPFELVVSGDQFGSFAIATDGTVFGTGTIDTVPYRAFRVVGGQLEAFGKVQLWGLTEMIVHGADLIAVASNGVPSLVTTDLATQQRRILSRTGRTLGNLAADDEAIYWLSGNGLSVDTRIELWRSPRGTEESVLLAELDGGDHIRDLVLLDDHFFFLRSTGDDLELVRIAKDGGGASEAIEVFENAGSLTTDGRDLFFSFTAYAGGTDPGTLHIVRVDAATFETETLFEMDDLLGSTLVAGDGPYLYWTTFHPPDDWSTLWRGLSDGRGVPEEIGKLDGFAHPVIHDGALYAIAECASSTNESETYRSHIVKLAD